jgi:hypothetical protein
MKDPVFLRNTLRQHIITLIGLKTKISRVSSSVTGQQLLPVGRPIAPWCLSDEIASLSRQALATMAQEIKKQNPKIGFSKSTNTHDKEEIAPCCL